MGVEQGHNPELTKEIEPRERTSLRELWQRAKIEITDSVMAWIKDEDKEVMRFERAIDRSVELGRQAGELYQNLIPHSLKKPDKKYEHKERPPVFEEFERQKLKTLQRLYQEKPRSEFEKIKQIALKGSTQERFGDLLEEKDGDTIYQLAEGIFRQEGEENIIEESAYNTLFEEINITISKLVIRNTAAGTRIDLQQLLPSGFEFMPAEMRQTHSELNEEKTKIETTIIPIDLRSYRGTKGSTGSFSEVESIKEVRYGDLTKKGGLLSLLHEISHAWQNVFYQEYGRPQFEELYKEITMALALVSHFQEELKLPEQQTEWDKQYFRQEILRPKREKLAELGVEFDETGFASPKQLKPHELGVINDITEHTFIVKSDKLKNTIADYASQERDAWAHAIRVLRFLRRQGFDLEPQIKTLADFREAIDHCLDSYQRWLDRRVEFSPAEKHPPRFLKRTKAA